ncbi:hypothetical protein [Wolbachia endosymbiont (group A) of Conops quadrifasciatus]|uniref:hypothetical protein n=1 Tax=Wolbachia endosymbiont (group A) of Conops quadrifasciatus TaxID=3066143 RepID=UPI0031334318
MIGQTDQGLKPMPLPRKLTLQTNNEASSHEEAENNISKPLLSEGKAPAKPPRLQLESCEEKPDNVEEQVSEEHIYATIDPSKKSSKRSLESDSGIDNRSAEVTRSNSQETEMSESCGSQEWEDISLNHDSSVILSTNSPEKSDGEVNSETSLVETEKKINKIRPRVKYAVQQKGFIIFSITALVLSTSAALVYLQDKAQFIGFFANSPLYITIPIVAITSLLAISPIFCAVKQFKSTEECHIQGKNANETLNKVLEYQRKDKVIKSVRLEYSNGTHSNFTLNAWKSEKNFINIDEKVISRRNKVEAVIKDRPIFTALLTAVVATNIALPIGLLAIGGVNNVKTFYQNPLSNNIGLSLLIGSSMVALLIVCLGVHYYRKTNCTNLVYSEERIDPEKVNEKFIEEIKEERIKVLEENHSKEAKCSSLTLEQVVVESHNCKDAVYSIG